MLAGKSTRYDALELVSGETDEILAALGAARPADASRLVEAGSAKALSSGPRQEPQAARVPAGRCRRPGACGRWRGATRRSSASAASPTSPSGR